MSQGGIGLLARTADDAEDPQTLRMVAGAIANLCGNGDSLPHPYNRRFKQMLFDFILPYSLPHYFTPFLIGLCIIGSVSN